VATSRLSVCSSSGISPSCGRSSGCARGAKLLAREEDEDLVQSVCVEILRDADDFEYRGLPSFKRWLYLNALRKIRDRARFHGRQRRDVQREVAMPTEPQDYSGFGSLLTPSRAAIQAEEVARLERAFDELSDEHREVITLSRIVGLSHEEIAQEMQRSPGATRVLLHRALARLGSLLTRD
jgi:RNA polymerase sigma factor (sigma-70 family)